MNLLEVRTDFIKKSGRFDLVVDTTDYVDNGANAYIVAGQKYLDKLVEVPENTGMIYASLAIGAYSMMFQQHCRSIENVFVNSSSERYELIKVPLRDLKTYYTELVSALVPTAPVYYALANLRVLDMAVKNSLGTFLNLTYDDSDVDFDYRGIIVAPPVDEAYVVEVTGKFSQLVLTDDEYSNFWSIEYPHLLVMAALRSVEIFNRNTEGSKDWEYAIKEELLGLDKDIAHEESFDVTQMKG